MAGRVTTVESTPFDGVSGRATLIGRAGVRVAASARLGRVLGGAAVVHDEPVPQIAPAHDVQRSIADTVNADVSDWLRAALAPTEDSAGVNRDRAKDGG